MNNKKIEKILQIIIVLLIILNGINIYNKFYRDNKEELNTSLFAMQIRDDENENYRVYSSNKFPVGYDLEKVECTNKDKNLIEDGNLPEFNYDSASGTLRGNIDKGIYCLLSFGKHKDMGFTFELNGTGEYNGEKYTNKKNIEAIFNWNYDGIDSYCISTNLNGNNCEWKTIKPDSGGNLKATIALNLQSDENKKQVYYGFLKAKDTISTVQVASITYDNVKPTCEYKNDTTGLGLLKKDNIGLNDGDKEKTDYPSLYAGTFTSTVKDRAGNEGSCSIELVDKEQKSSCKRAFCSIQVPQQACNEYSAMKTESTKPEFCIGCVGYGTGPTYYCCVGCNPETFTYSCPKNTTNINNANYCIKK